MPYAPTTYFKRLFVITAAVTGLCAASACHARKAAGTKQDISHSTAVPPGGSGVPDTSQHTPTANIAPRRVPNARPKPVPNPQPPVPPM